MKSERTALVIILFIMLFVVQVNAQDDLNRVPPQNIACGDDLEGEFATAREERAYTLSADAGTSVTVSVDAIANQPQMLVLVTDPSGFGIAISDGRMDAGQTVFFPGELQTRIQLTDLILSATGTYTLRVTNSSFRNFMFGTGKYKHFSSDDLGGIGLYSISVECIDRNGNPIPMPDDDTDLTDGPVIQPPAATNLIPDFTALDPIPLPLGVAMGGAIMVDAGPVTAYTLDATEGQQLTLDVARINGALNLGVVLLSPSGEVLSLSSLFSANTMTVSTVLPASGQYRIGIFRFDALPHASTDVTSFLIHAALSG